MCIAGRLWTACAIVNVYVTIYFAVAQALSIDVEKLNCLGLVSLLSGLGD